MSFFSKAVSDLTRADLEALVADQATENIRLEFKSEMPKREKPEMLKKISSFANTYGGDLVVGVEEDGNGRAVGVPGVEPIDGFDQKIRAWCSGGVYPPVASFISPPILIDAKSGKVAYVIRVEESHVAPHFLNGRGGCWVRSGEHSSPYEPVLADEREIEHLIDRRRAAIERREALRARSLARFRTHVDQDYESHGRSVGSLGATLHVWLGPLHPVAPLIETADLLQGIRDSAITSGGTRFPNPSDPILQHESVLVKRSRTFGLIEVTTWGSIHVSTEIESVPTGDSGEGNELNVQWIAGWILRTMKFAESLLGRLGFDGSLFLNLDLERIRGVSVSLGRPSSRLGTLSAFDDQLTARRRLLTHQLSDPQTLFESIMSEIAHGLGWQHGASDAGTSQLWTDAHRWNHWPVPE